MWRRQSKSNKWDQEWRAGKLYWCNNLCHTQLVPRSHTKKSKRRLVALTYSFFLTIATWRHQSDCRMKPCRMWSLRVGPTCCRWLLPYNKGMVDGSTLVNFNCEAILSCLWDERCQLSPVHSYGLLGQTCRRGTNWPGRSFWLCMFSFCYLASVLVHMASYKPWQTNYHIQNFDTKYSQVGKEENLIT